MEKASDGQDGPTNDVEFSIRFTTFHRSLQHLYIPSLHSQLYNGVTADIEDVLFGTKNPDGYLYIVPRRRLPSLKSDLLMHLIICEIFHKGLEIIVPLHMLNNSRSDQRVYLILDYCQVRTVPPNRTQIWYHHHQPTNHPSIHPSIRHFSCPSIPIRPSNLLVPARIFTPIIHTRPLPSPSKKKF
jgi:hypothetical protein